MKDSQKIGPDSSSSSETRLPHSDEKSSLPAKFQSELPEELTSSLEKSTDLEMLAIHCLVQVPHL